MIKFLKHLGESGLQEVNSRQGLWHSIRERPLKKSHVSLISEKLGLQQKDAAELAGVSIRTFQRQKNNTTITYAASENILKLAELYETGLTAFDGNEESFLAWLNTPVPALNNEKPIKLLSSGLGIDLVKEELMRIEYGIY